MISPERSLFKRGIRFWTHMSHCLRVVLLAVVWWRGCWCGGGGGGVMEGVVVWWRGLWCGGGC